jgi:uncharacterized membrane protein YcaP (DUF421 family)
MGNKELAQITALDLAFVVILADLVAGVLHTKDLYWYHMLFLCGGWAILIWIVEWLTYEFNTLDRWVVGKPELIVKDGEINWSLMRKMKMTRKELDSMLRQQGVFELEQVDKAIMEVSGKISVKQKGR